MKICTFNIWDSETSFTKRLDLLIEEINKNEIDIIALQEVRDEKTFNAIKSKTNFNFGIYYKGLAFLSNFEIKEFEKESSNNNFLLRVVTNDTSFTNVHLDWKTKQNRLFGLDTYFNMLEKNALDNEFVLGDFNDIPEDQIHFDLIMSDYTDIHQMFSHSSNELPLPTLDIENNPRWRKKKTDEDPARFDWIMLNTINTFKIKSVKLIGVEETNGVTPSDHYGVFTEVEIKN